MASSKPSGLARFTRQGAVPTSPRPSEPAGSSATPPADTADAAASIESRASRSRGGGKAKLVGVYLMPDGHRQLKVEAAKRGMTISDLVREAVNTWFTNESLPPLA